MVNFQTVQRYIEQNSRHNKRVILLLVICPLIILFTMNATIWAPPRNIQIHDVYSIPYSQTISGLAHDLSMNEIIQSEFWFKVFVHLFSPFKHTIIAGSYSIDQKQSVWAFAFRFSHGDYRLIPVKVTIPEGFSSKDIADLLSKKLKNFNSSAFLKKVQENKLEGYLFPDTYFLADGMDSGEIIKALNSNFTFQIKSIESEIRKFGTLQDVIIMASILEKEARTQETRRIIAGILWKRIQFLMPLQVDATLYYILGKTSAELSVDDLKINSPYNTYVVNGLPPGAISNPGIEAIKDTVNPIITPYLYFLSDNDGNMHYAKNLEEHLVNIKKYLRK